MSDLSNFELGWLVGLLEGEGSFILKGNSQSIRLKMTDEDTVNRYAALIERITEKQRADVNVLEYAPDNKFGQQNVFVCVINGERARTIMRLIVRHMSWRRRQRIWQCLNGYSQPKIDIFEVLGLQKKESV